MEEIQHKHVQVGSLKLHFADIGSGPKVVLFLHGFPEIWYSWRHQMVAVAKEGYRAIAMDFRGYGLSDHPSEPEKSTFTDFAEDVIGLLDSLGIHKVFLVGKDFAPIVMSVIAVVYPERLNGFITLGVPFTIPGFNSGVKLDAHPKGFYIPRWQVFLVGKDFAPIIMSVIAVVYPERLNGFITLGAPFMISGIDIGVKIDAYPKGFYIPRWQEPGRAEADFGRFDVKTVIRNIYTMFCWSELQIASEDQEIMDLVAPETPLPPWFSEDDLSVYSDLYEKSGFRTALQVPYRTLTKTIEVEDPKVTVPALLIMGEKDYVFKFPGMEDYIRTGIVKKFVPDLEIVFIPEGNHFVQEQLPEEVNQLIVSFLNKQTIQ